MLKYLGIKGHGVYNLLSNDSAKITMITIPRERDRERETDARWNP